LCMSELNCVLEKYATIVNRQIEQYIPRAGQPVTLHQPMWELLDRGGKRFRPALTLLFCKAVGEQERRAIPAASAVEILHNMTLIHDDIEDQSELRRGKPCIHIMFGQSAAINSGDAMLIKVFEAVASGSLDATTRNKLVQRFAERAFQITRGQALEFELNNRQDFTEEDVIEVLRNKTSALIALACEAGVIAAGGKKSQLSAAAKFGEATGVGFQIVDDLLNVTGDVRKYGKEIGGDIREGKRTIMAAHLVKSASTEDRQRFMKMLGKSTISQEEIGEAIDLYRKYGSLDHARRLADRFIEGGLSALKKLPKSSARDTIEGLARFMVRRET
jgi:geranylgeranyl diphosphate synthase type I